MELIFLFCLYYLSQNPDFSESMKPLLGSLKNSEQMLKFMNDLSHFSELFSVLNQKSPPKTEETKQANKNSPPKKEGEQKTTEKKESEKEKRPQSPTEGIADEFIERCLNNYFKNR